ncbi:putative L-PSP endoribonuclease family protein [Pseudomassariella vexata]|uniref:Putative L-PSP endoribonuclease family protein n=1 Tax=Pseudomassariella vexata TaxID=1141098 RepID=A0A1Y2E3P2_9PEZI|nr:putative L-PSP endoribonuclease family protein [Pseudomassariella vexata]ORY66142.1 putative L-PSP endoribonuclease family protein [Pseudomassariella vexata]
MSHLQYFSYPDQGAVIADNAHYSQAVRVNGRIECAGQGGWDPKTGEISENIHAEIDQAFANVDINLKHAGGKGWSQAFRVTAYSTDLNEKVFLRLKENLEKWCPDHKPILTGFGVSQLGLLGMRIEIEVVAHDGK